MGFQIKSIEEATTGNQSKIEKLEHDLQSLKLETSAQIAKELTAAQNNNSNGNDNNLTVVMGNMPSCTTLQEAKDWLAKRCVDSGAPQPLESYCKSEAFNGILFAKCLSASHRDQIIASVRKFSGASFPKTWAKIDQPIDIRTAENTLFAFKRMLVEWGYNKSCIQVNRQARTLKVAGTEVLETMVENHELKMKWCNGGWEKWEDLQSAQELMNIKKDVQEKLNRAKAGASTDKGQGKGPIIQ
jgi:hypothetical protein